jgi:hypothetical protein
MAKFANGHYSLVQYCPSASRLEAANIGVLLYCQELRYVDVRLARGNSRIVHFFGREGFDSFVLEGAKKAVEHRVRLGFDAFKTYEDMELLIQTRANAVVLSAARSIKVDDPVKTLDELFGELVGGAVRTRADRRFREVDEILGRPSLKALVHRPQPVIVPVVNRRLTAPYAFRNGRFNLIRPERFSAHPGAATGAAMRLAMEGDLLDKYLQVDGIKAQLIIVPFFPAESQQNDRASVLRLFGEYHVRTVDVPRLEELADEIQRTAH